MEKQSQKQHKPRNNRQKIVMDLNKQLRETIYPYSCELTDQFRGFPKGRPSLPKTKLLTCMSIPSMKNNFSLKNLFLIGSCMNHTEYDIKILVMTFKIRKFKFNDATS